MPSSNPFALPWPNMPAIPPSSATSSATKSPAPWSAGSACVRSRNSSSTSSASHGPRIPNVLYSYASFPPTEFLLPQNVDFVCFNVYLHHQDEFERYLLRLQNLAEDRPLILGEFGMDTIRHGEDEQAEMLGWHVESVARCGLAGTIFFAWTDEWFTGEQEITDWAFGLVTRDRTPKKVFHLLRDKLGPDNSRPAAIAVLRDAPFVSVIVCSYNGAKTLEACLDSLGRIDYPAYEVILVDDGSTDETRPKSRALPEGSLHPSEPITA